MLISFLWRVIFLTEFIHRIDKSIILTSKVIFFSTQLTKKYYCITFTELKTKGPFPFKQNVYCGKCQLIDIRFEAAKSNYSMCVCLMKPMYINIFLYNFNNKEEVLSRHEFISLFVSHIIMLTYTSRVCIVAIYIWWRLYYC